MKETGERREIRNEMQRISSCLLLVTFTCKPEITDHILKYIRLKLSWTGDCFFAGCKTTDNRKLGDGGDQLMNAAIVVEKQRKPVPWPHVLRCSPSPERFHLIKGEMPRFRSLVLISIFMTYYLIGISCPKLSSSRIRRRNLAIYVDRSSKMILGVGVVWSALPGPGAGRRCCCNRTTTRATAVVPWNTLPTTRNGITPPTINPPAPTSPADATPPSPSQTAGTPQAPGPAFTETTPPETVTVRPGNQLQRNGNRNRGLQMQGKSRDRKADQCPCTLDTHNKKALSRSESNSDLVARNARLTVASSSHYGQKGAKTSSNSGSSSDASSSAAGFKEQKGEGSRNKDCISFRSRIYCMPRWGRGERGSQHHPHVWSKISLSFHSFLLLRSI